MPGTLRCKFHPLAMYPANYVDPPFHVQPPSYVELPADAQPPALTDNPGSRIAAALDASEKAVAETAVADPVFRLEPLTQQEALAAALDDDDLHSKSHAPGPVPENANSNADENADEMEDRFVYDSAKDDYVKTRVSVHTQAPAYASDPSVHHDGFELGPAYYEGDNAAFDHRWINKDARQNLTDRKNGFVPMKQALDNRFRLEGGVVTFGDLILAHRPKEITAQRAREMVRTHERVTGEIASFHNEGSRNGVNTFGSVREGDDNETREASRPRQEERQPAPRGGKSYSFPNNPIGRDLVAERHGSVGG